MAMDILAASEDLNQNAAPASTNASPDVVAATAGSSLAGPGVYMLKPTCQNYAWGKIGPDSAVARYLNSAYSDSVTIDPTIPYAELWMGTHPRGPNIALGVGPDGEMPLKTLIETCPELLGEPVVDQFGKGSLPFLFKVLSVSGGEGISIGHHIQTF